jgi:very-short-patch-repair endonuclease
MNLGIMSRAELLASDLTDNDLRRMVRRGELTQVRRGWYAKPDADTTALSACRRGGSLSCVSALKKHGVWVPPGYDSLHVRATKHAQCRRRDFCVLPGRPLPIDTILDSVPVALACAARCMTDEDWIACADSVMNSQGIKVAELRSQLPYVSAHIDRLLLRCDHRSQSGTESLVRDRLYLRGFHVEVQPAIDDVGHVDLKLGRLLLECDSKLHHTSLESYRKDRRRDRKSVAQNLISIRLTYDDVLYGWDETLEDILAITKPGKHRLSRLKTSP